MRQTGSALIGIMIAVLAFGLVFVFLMKGDSDEEGGQTRMEQYNQNIQDAEEIKNVIESRNNVEF